MNTPTPTDILEARLKELEEKWHKELKTKDKAGGNSNDNFQRIMIKGELERRKNDG